MKKKSTHRTFTILLLLLFVWSQFITPIEAQQQSKIIISTSEQIKEEFNQVPCKDAERLNAVKTLFEKMGAAATDISIEKYKHVENLMIRLPGATDEKIVIGAHYDKVMDGCGAIDNWTGIVAMAHIYRTVKDHPLKKTLLFVAFGKEEKGLIGSQAMTKAIKKEEAERFCAMINIDSLGLTAPQVISNLSNGKLEALAAGLAKQMKMPFKAGNIDNADADSSSFLKKKIPALTISALPGNWPSILHTGNDQAAKVNAESVYLGYRLALAVLASATEAPCNAYR